MRHTLNSLDAQINDYLLIASGHLHDAKPTVDVRQLAAFGAAASSALVMMSQAEAAIVMNGGTAPPLAVVNGVGSMTMNSQTSLGAHLFNMNMDKKYDFSIWGYTNKGNNGLAPATSGNAIVGGNGSGNSVRKLSAGFTIGPGNNWVGSNSPNGTNQDIAFALGKGASNWSGGADEFGFVGVRFQTGTSEPTTHYGWICLRSQPHKNSASISVQAYAYETAIDTPIHAGDTGTGKYACAAAPIPAGHSALYGLSVLAAVGLEGLRRRRKSRAQQA